MYFSIITFLKPSPKLLTKKTAFFLILLVVSLSGFGQQKNYKAKKFYKKAYEYYSYGNYEKSIEWANKALEKDSFHSNTLVLFSDIYNITRQFDQELKIYKKLLRIDSTDIRSHVNMADIYLKTGEFEKAFKHYSYIKSAEWLPERYEPLISKNTVKSKAALEILNNPKDFNRTYLKGEVNSDLDEYWPFITPDGKKLFFTRTNFTHEPGSSAVRREENIYSTKGIDSSWLHLYKLPDVINTLENEGAQCITQDGKTMFFTVCKTTEGRQGDCNIYYTTWRKKKWSTPTRLPSPVNTLYKETQPSISYDGKTLFFSSDRPGGEGGMDIWVSRMNEDSFWANPINLGSFINTSQNEESPFIHPDNRTLYFSSTGHLGLGNGDFFMTKLNSKLKPVNLGYPLNNHEMQLGIYVDLEGNFGYYASVNPELNSGLDIYRFNVPDDVKPDPLKIIRGRLIDAVSLEPIKDGDIVVYNLKKDQHVVSYTTLNDGSFKFGLPATTQFAILAEAEGYLPHSLHSKVESLTQDSLIEIALNPILANGTFALKNIFFDFDQSNLQEISRPEIKYLANFLEKNPSIEIEIGGHTDNVGNNSYNLDLSEKRAQEVFNALEKELGKAISKRVQVKGYGDTMPIATNKTEAGRQKNRRTEIKIISVN